MDKTKLNENDPAHRLLIATLATLVDDFGYTAREVYQLVEHSKKRLFFTLQELEREQK